MPAPSRRVAAIRGSRAPDVAGPAAPEPDVAGPAAPEPDVAGPAAPAGSQSSHDSASHADFTEHRDVPGHRLCAAVPTSILIYIVELCNYRAMSLPPGSGPSLGVDLLGVVARLNRLATQRTQMPLPRAQARLLSTIDDRGRGPGRTHPHHTGGS